MLIIFFYIIFFYLLGAASLPKELVLANKKNRIVAELLATLLGMTIWMTLSVGLGRVCSFTSTYLLVLLTIIVIFIIIRRKYLFLPRMRESQIILLVAFLAGCFVTWHTYPLEKDGMLLFNQASYDYTRSAIIRSIATFGLPPRNPWLAENGISEILVYYYGWYALAAQIPLLTNMHSLASECFMAGVSTFAVLSWIAAITIECDHRDRRSVWLFLFFLIFFTGILYQPDNEWFKHSFVNRLLPDETAGFWPISCNLIISPHHSFAGATIIMLNFFHRKMFRTNQLKLRIHLSILIGMILVAAVFSSVYAGAIAIVFIILTMLILRHTNVHVRIMLRKNLLIQPIFIIISGAFTFFFIFKYLLAYPSEDFPLAFGIPTGFDGTGIVDWITSLTKFYFVYLPLRLGWIYIIGMAIILIPCLLKDVAFIGGTRYFILLCFAAIGMVHSSYYSNDFGWRLITAATYYLAVFTAIWLSRFFDNYVLSKSKRKKIVGYGVVVLMLLSCSCMWNNRTSGILRLDNQREMSRNVKAAVPAWETVRKHTELNDMVLSNPEGGVSSAGIKWFGKYTTNIFFSFFADRPTPIGDMIFSKCYSEFYPEEKLRNTFLHVKYIFNNAADLEDINYLADDLKVKAIVVTQWDKLWKYCNILCDKYDMIEETDSYKVFIQKENDEI